MYDVFLSYSRVDQVLCDSVARLLRDFGLSPFVDRAIPGGRAWKEEIGECLRSEEKPMVIVLASRAAAASQAVAGELVVAGFQGLPIIVMRVDREGVRDMGLKTLQVIDVQNQDPSTLDEATSDQLWLALHPKLLKESLQRHRADAAMWHTAVLSPTEHVDFWGTDWVGYFPDVADHDDARVLTARSGSGKSVVVAHFVKTLLETDPRGSPVVLPLEILTHGRAAISHFLGARSPEVLVEHVGRMRKNLDQHVVFVVDGLEQIVGRLGAEEVAATLDLLRSASALLITCRTEVWEANFPHLGIEQKHVDELKLPKVQSILARHTAFTSLDVLPLLQIPFYLDATIRYRNTWQSLPTTETEILSVLWDAYCEVGTKGAIPSIPGEARRVLRLLAEKQLQDMTYEVSIREFTHTLAQESSLLEALRRLEDGGVIRRRAVRGDAYVRLRHDLLDCFSMVKALLDSDARPGSLELVYARAADECGWPLISMLAQVCYDAGNEALKREIFGELLHMLDRKRCGPISMARAWAATYVLRDKLTSLLPLVLECLDGEVLGRVRCVDNEPRVSQIGLHAGATQEAASSLASAFAAQETREVVDPERVIPVLERGLGKWEYRRRFVDALATYHQHDVAVAVLEEFARIELDSGQDPGILGAVAAALGPPRRPSSVSILDEIISSPSIDRRTLRVAMKSKNKVTRPIEDPEPEVTEEEIIENLNPHDSTGGYSDWSVVVEGVGYLKERIRQGRLSSAMIDAAVLALQHQQTYARTAVADCLGLMNDPRAFVALLEAAVEPSPPSELRRALGGAIRRQLSSPATRQARRWFVGHAARDARRAFSLSMADELDGIVNDSTLGGGLLISGDALEIASSGAVAHLDDEQRPVFTFARDEADSVDGWATALVEDDDLRSVGGAWETKYRFCGVDFTSGSWNVCLSKTSWEVGAGFHKALRRQPAFSASLVRGLETLTAGKLRLPGLAVVHCIVISGDEKLLLGRRSWQLQYDPGKWSASFEEQINTSDVAPNIDNPATHAVVRGFDEEFGIPAGSVPCHSCIVSAMIEVPILNPGLVVILEPQATYAEIANAWRKRTAERGVGEIIELNCVDAVPERLLAVANGKERNYSDLHATSAMRLILAANWVARR